MSYRLINANALNGVISDDDYEKVLKAPCIFADLPNGLDGKHYNLQEPKTEPKYCDRSICVLNEYNGIGCEDCEVTKSQEPKTGHWIAHPEIETSTPEYLMFYECSECGDKQCFCKTDIHKKRFCTNCGARMAESEDKE